MLYTFKSYPASTKATFTCPGCEKPKRNRTFRSECTVNPFNKKEDGSIRMAAEVRAQSVAQANIEREQFLRAPLCASCEGKLPFNERRQLFDKRRSP